MAEQMRTDAGRRLNEEFPIERTSVLPTRLGNVIRSFEDYPERQYGMDGVTLWPRLVAKINKDHATVIEDAKITFDFLLNSAVLSAVLIAYRERCKSEVA
jgi:hypothetical protein